MRSLVLASFLLGLAACSKQPAAAATSFLRVPHGLEQAQLVTAADNAVTPQKYELGKQLFFDPRISGTGKTACAACHVPEQAFTDGRATSPKDDGSMNTRNSPTMHNVGYLDRLYWDGRAKSLEANVLAAWKAQTSAKPEEIATRLAAVPAYATAFQRAFGAGPNEDTIVKALATFLRYLRSGDSAYDRFRGGDENAISAQAKAGAELFVGKAGCTNCHKHEQGLFTDRTFHNAGIGMAKENPDVGAAAKTAFDDPTRTGQFKTPTLRDVAKTAPYFHDGSVPTLREAVATMAKGGIENPHKDPLLKDRPPLTDAEIDQLVAFLESLTGNVAFTPPEMPK